MKKVRSYLAVFALVATLSGSIILGTGLGSLANTVSSHHVSAASVAGKSTQTAFYKPWCPIPGIDC